LKFQFSAGHLTAYIASGGEVDSEVMTAVPVSVLNNAMKKQRRETDAYRVLLALLQEGVANEHSLVSFFSCCAHTGKGADAVEFWRSMREHPLSQLGPAGCSALLQAATTAPARSLPVALLGELREAACELSILSYNIVLSHCIKSDDMDSAMKVFGTLRYDSKHSDSWGAPPDPYTYSIMLNGLIRFRRFDLLNQFRTTLADDRIETTPYLWADFACAYARSRDFDQAFEMLEELEVLDVPEDVTPFLLSGYNAVMSVLGKMGNFEDALELYDAKFCGPRPVVSPDKFTLVALLNAAGRSYVQEAATVTKLCREVEAVLDGPPDVHIRTAIMTCWRKVADMTDKERLEKVLATYTDLRGAGLAPTTTTHNVVIAAFLDLGDFSHALAQYRVMEAEGVLPDKVTFKLLQLIYEALDDHEKVAEMAELRRSLNIIHGRRD